MNVYRHCADEELMGGIDSNERVLALIFERAQEAITAGEYERADGLLKDARTTLAARMEIMHELGRRSAADMDIR